MSAFLIAALRSDTSSLRISDMYSSQPVFSTPHAEKNLSKFSLDSQLRKSAMQRVSLITHARISDWHDDFDFVFAAAACNVFICADMPAALHDCSIKESYVSDTSSAVHPETLAKHCFVAQAYRWPGSVGAFCKSLSDILYFADAPAETLRIFDVGGVPALAVPQY